MTGVIGTIAGSIVLLFLAGVMVDAFIQDWRCGDSPKRPKR